MKKIWLLLLLCPLGLRADPLGYTGEVFEQNSNGTKKIFDFKLEAKVDGNSETIRASFTDPLGVLALEENAVLNGNDLVRSEIDQKQTQQKGIIEVKDGRVYFTRVDQGKEKKSDEKLASTLVVSSNFQKFITSHWQTLTAGKSVEFRYGVWDRMETVGFEVFKTGQEKKGDQNLVLLKMKPANFLISTLVKPLIFKFSEDGSHLLEMNGRVAPKQKDGNSYKDLDAEVHYKY